MHACSKAGTPPAPHPHAAQLPGLHAPLPAMPLPHFLSRWMTAGRRWSMLCANCRQTSRQRCECVPCVWRQRAGVR